MCAINIKMDLPNYLISNKFATKLIDCSKFYFFHKNPSIFFVSECKRKVKPSCLSVHGVDAEATDKYVLTHFLQLYSSFLTFFRKFLCIVQREGSGVRRTIDSSLLKSLTSLLSSPENMTIIFPP